MNINVLAEALEPVVREAGDIIVSYFKGATTRDYKNDGSFATQADIESERFLIKRLKDLLPGAGFFAEESGEIEGNEYCWVIDPLDGTNNFAQGIPYFCSSVALTKNKKPILGLIFNPLQNEMFIAIQGKGAFLNGSRLTISPAKEIDKSIAIFAFPYEENLAFFKIVCTLEKRMYTSRILGAAALDQAYCAAGRADLVLFAGLSWWDVAAGMLLIEEAGGAVAQFDGSPITPSYSSFIGGNKPICQKISSLIADL